jgi:hypothetical protein
MTANDPITPRYFWRRIFAFSLDYLMVSVLAFALVALLATSERRVISPPFINFGTFGCQNIQQILPELRERLQNFNFDFDRIASARVCERRSFGMLVSRQFVLHFDRKATEHGWATKTMSVEITPRGEIVGRYAPNGLLAIGLLFVGSAAFANKGRRSPGKALLGLRISPNPSPWRRELRKLWPLILISGVSLLGQVLAGPWLLDLLLRDAALGIAAEANPVSLFQVSFAAGAGLLVFLLWYYVWPLIRWRGATRYDHATGSHVIRG